MRARSGPFIRSLSIFSSDSLAGDETRRAYGIVVSCGLTETNRDPEIILIRFET